jgi:hypothetical protein
MAIVDPFPSCSRRMGSLGVQADHGVTRAHGDRGYEGQPIPLGDAGEPNGRRPYVLAGCSTVVSDDGTNTLS